jgi:hypothetical protein
VGHDQLCRDPVRGYVSIVHTALLFFDIAERDPCENLPDFMPMVGKPVLLAGTKSGLMDQPKISTEEAKQFPVAYDFG